MGRFEEDQISSCITHIKNLTSLTLSKYNELNGQVTLLESTKTSPLKKSSVPNQSAQGEKADLKKDLLVLKTKNWRTLAGRRLAWKRLPVRRPRPTRSCRGTQEGRKEYFALLL
ncbi:hypothetical protein TNCV_2618151 [Trichonephila clavipes]|nr:hypothetical protein TNCV_2618151 [Trichonephila clavipes]